MAYCVLFSMSQSIFSFPLWFHFWFGCFNSMLFNFNIFEIFHFSFLLISYLHYILVRKDTSVFFNILRLVQWPILENFPCVLWRMLVLLLLGGVFIKVLLVLCFLILCCRCSAYQLLNMEYWYLTTFIVAQFCQCLLHRFGGFAVWCMYIYNCRIFLVDWPFYLYKMSSLSLMTSFYLKSIFWY